MITKDMSITEIVSKYPNTFPVFSQYGLHCIGCISANFENLEQGALAHGINVENLVADLNRVI